MPEEVSTPAPKGLFPFLLVSRRVVRRRYRTGHARRAGVSHLEVGHAEFLLVLDELLGERVRRNTALHLLLDLVDEAEVELDVLLAVLERERTPGCEEVGQLEEDRKRFDKVLARNAARGRVMSSVGIKREQRELT